MPDRLTDRLTQIEEERAARVKAIPLQKGRHASLEAGACLLELVSYVAGERWSDSPGCVSPCIAAALRSWNDAMDDADRQLLRPLIPQLLNTVAPDFEERRAYIAIDWFIRVFLVAWLDLAQLTEASAPLKSMAPVETLEDLEALLPALSAAESAASHAAGSVAWHAAGHAALSAASHAAESAAWSAVGHAAESVAWHAAESAASHAALSAAESAAWSAVGHAAESAVGSVAWHAAGCGAWNAASHAAWSVAWHAAGHAALSAASHALRPTVLRLQASAMEMVQRMIALPEEAPCPTA